MSLKKSRPGTSTASSRRSLSPGIDGHGGLLYALDFTDGHTLSFCTASEAMQGGSAIEHGSDGRTR
jgi:hypothetical protein